jgi:hypothetical protein
MRPFFPSVIVCSVIFLAPSAHGGTLLPGPIGSGPSDKSFFLTFDSDGHGNARSYVVDSKGLYERDSWSRSNNSGIGVFNDHEGSSNKGSSANLSFNSSNSKGSSGGVGTSFSGAGGFSGGASSGSGASLAGSGGFFSMKGFEEGLGSAGGKKGLESLSSILGSDGPGTKGLGNSASVSATPLPASWTMMLIGLGAFGLLGCFRKLQCVFGSRLHRAAKSPV